MTEQAPSKLMSEVWRSLLAVGIASVVSWASIFGYGVWAIRSTGRIDTTLNLLIAMLSVFVVMFVVYQGITWRVFARLGPKELIAGVEATNPHGRAEKRLQYWLASGPRSWSVSAGLLSLSVVAVVIIDDRLRGSPVMIIACLIAVATSWTMVIFAFAISYLRNNVEESGQLRFPDRDRNPDLVWRDYFYLSVQVSTTFSASDVEVTSTRMRSEITAHSIVAFVFNTVIVALLVSMIVTVA